MPHVFTCREHAPRGGNREQPNGGFDVVGNCRPGRGAIKEPAFPRVAAEQGLLLAGGELDPRDPLRRERQDAPRLHMRTRGIDRPAAGDRDHADHQTGGDDADDARKAASHRRRHHTAAPNSMTPSGSNTSTKRKVTCICRWVSRISGRL